MNHRFYPTPNFANDSKNTGKHQVQMEYSFFLEEPQRLDTDSRNVLFFCIRICYDFVIVLSYVCKKLHKGSYLGFGISCVVVVVNPNPRIFFLLIFKVGMREGVSEGWRDGEGWRERGQEGERGEREER